MAVLKTFIAHVVGSNHFVVLDEEFEAVLGKTEGYENARHLALLIEARNEAFDFERVYEIYPRKGTKASGLKWLRQHVKSKSRFDKVMEAVNNYRRHCTENDTPLKFTLQFVTWVKRFDDWTNENAPRDLTKYEIENNPLKDFDVDEILGGM